jgi:hypothetical protein
MPRRWTKAEVDASFAKQIVHFLYQAGKTRADSVVRSTGSIGFETWLIECLAKRDAMIAQCKE